VPYVNGVLIAASEQVGLELSLRVAGENRAKPTGQVESRTWEANSRCGQQTTRAAYRGVIRGFRRTCGAASSTCLFASTCQVSQPGR
jgi:hypothetical protein